MVASIYVIFSMPEHSTVEENKVNTINKGMEVDHLHILQS